MVAFAAIRFCSAALMSGRRSINDEGRPAGTAGGSSCCVKVLVRTTGAGLDPISLLIGSSPAPVVRTRTLTQQELPPAVPAGLPSSLIERRPDIRAAEQNLIAANAAIGVAKAAYFPQISLTGLFGFQSNQLSSLFTGATRTWQFTPAINQPIFAGGRLKNN